MAKAVILFYREAILTFPIAKAVFLFYHESDLPFPIAKAIAEIFLSVSNLSDNLQDHTTIVVTQNVFQ